MLFPPAVKMPAPKLIDDPAAPATEPTSSEFPFRSNRPSALIVTAEVFAIWLAATNCTTAEFAAPAPSPMVRLPIIAPLAAPLFSPSVPSLTSVAPVKVFAVAPESVKTPVPFFTSPTAPPEMPLEMVVLNPPVTVRTLLFRLTKEVTARLPAAAFHDWALPRVTPVVPKVMLCVFTELFVIPLESVTAFPPRVKLFAPALKVMPATVAVALFVVTVFAAPANCRPTAKLGAVSASQFVLVPQLPFVSPSQIWPALAGACSSTPAASSAAMEPRSGLMALRDWVFVAGVEVRLVFMVGIFLGEEMGRLGWSVGKNLRLEEWCGRRRIKRHATLTGTASAGDSAAPPEGKSPALGCSVFWCSGRPRAVFVSGSAAGVKVFLPALALFLNTRARRSLFSARTPWLPDDPPELLPVAQFEKKPSC